MDTKLERPLLVILGPTASGKTGLAIRLAREHRGEIICADSRTIYRRADIGTAKPMQDERNGIPHWGLDLVDIDERYSAAQFQEYANQKIDEIYARGNQPIIVGGTGLYVDSLLFGFGFRDSGAGPTWREELRNNTYVVGIATARDELTQRIRTRAKLLMDQGVVEEATRLNKNYAWTTPGMTGNVYRAVQSYLEGQLSLSDMKEKITTLDRQLAKRQMTWFRPNPYIEWCSLDDAYTYCMQLLADE